MSIRTIWIYEYTILHLRPWYHYCTYVYICISCTVCVLSCIFIGNVLYNICFHMYNCICFYTVLYLYVILYAVHMSICTFLSIFTLYCIFICDTLCYTCMCASVLLYLCTLLCIFICHSQYFIYIYMSICTSISVCILCCIKHFIFELMNNIFKSARTCFGSQRIHHQWALYSAWLKITKMILSCPLTWTRSVLWQHILTEIRWNNDGLFRDKLKAKTTLSKKSRYNKV